jgi:uncharacterized protein YutE (UPF0331/DUF86 family)
MRACEAVIDLAMHLVAAGRLGVPQETRDAFSILVEGAALPEDLAERLKRMVGFRNIAVHDYRALNLEVVGRIVTSRLGDFTDFTSWALQRS